MEKTMKNFPYHKKRRKAQFIAFSPLLRERIKSIRLELGIPTDGFPSKASIDSISDLEFYPYEATEWYKNHTYKVIGEYKDLSVHYWHFPKGLVNLIEEFDITNEPCRAGFHPEVPLDRQAMNLAHEFNLPEDTVSQLKRRILVDEKCSFALTSSLDPLVVIPVDEKEEGIKLCVCIAGIDGSTTRKDWLKLWHTLQTTLEMYGVRIDPTKRESEKNMQRDLNFWNWSRHGLSYREIADKWEDKKGETYGEDTIAAAIKRIDVLMQPLSDPDDQTTSCQD
jgi:hypothetical protein